MSDKPEPNCRACKFSYMEPDDDLTCGHPGAGSMGRYVKHRAEFKHCVKFDKFEQHPHRKPNGDLK